MLFLSILTYFASFLQLCFATISVAAGLYYLAEMVEEYSVLSKKIITLANIGTLIINICLWIFEGFPNFMIICGLLSQITHFAILKHFPHVYFMSPSFILGVVFIIINHYLAFRYFGEAYYSFSEVLAYFTICLWIVPFALFISLSANEMVLPTTSESMDGDVVTNYFSRKGKKYGLLTFFNYAKDSILPTQRKKGF